MWPRNITQPLTRTRLTQTTRSGVERTSHEATAPPEKQSPCLKLTLVVPVTRRTADQSGICYRDVCRGELFLVLTEAYQGEPRDKALALSLFLIFLALVIFAVTKPWG